MKRIVLIDLSEDRFYSKMEEIRKKSNSTGFVGTISKALRFYEKCLDHVLSGGEILFQREGKHSVKIEIE